MFPIFRPAHRVVLEKYRQGLLAESQVTRPLQRKQCFSCLHPTRVMLSEILACFGPGSWVWSMGVSDMENLWKEFRETRRDGMQTLEDFAEWMVTTQSFVDGASGTGTSKSGGHDPGNLLNEEQQAARLESIRRCLYVAGYLDNYEGVVA